MRFKTISNLKLAIKYVSKIDIKLNNKSYFINQLVENISINEEENYSRNKNYETTDKSLEHIIDEKNYNKIKSLEPNHMNLLVNNFSFYEL